MPARRLHVVLDGAQHERLLVESRRRGVSVGDLVREAVDLAVPTEIDRRRSVLERVGATVVVLPADPAELRVELDVAHDRLRS